jgi:hypothetical protein
LYENIYLFLFILAAKDVSAAIRDRLYTGGWDTVKKHLKEVQEGKATADIETILFSVERMTARKVAGIPDMSMYLFSTFSIPCCLFISLF